MAERSSVGRDVSIQRSARSGPAVRPARAPMVATRELRQPAGRIAQLLRDKLPASGLKLRERRGREPVDRHGDDAVRDARIGHLDPPAGVWKHGTSARRDARLSATRRRGRCPTPRRPGRGRFDFDDAIASFSVRDLPAAGRWAEAGVGELAHEPVAGYQAVGVGDGDPDRRRLGGGLLEPNLDCGARAPPGCPPGLPRVRVRPPRGACGSRDGRASSGRVSKLVLRSSVDVAVRSGRRRGCGPSSGRRDRLR